MELAFRAPTVQNIPQFFRGRWCFALTWALEELVKEENAPARNEQNLATRWKLLLLLPRLLLRRTEVDGEAGKQEYSKRYQHFLRGDWQELLREARTQST